MLRTLVLGLAFGLVLPSMVDAAWTRVQLVNGVQVCRDSVSGAQFKPPYSAKADVTKACNTLTSFLPWLGTVEAAPVLTHTTINGDGTQDLAYPSDAKNNATVSWNDTTLATAMSVVVAQNTGTATDINLLTYCTGTGCAAATYTLVTAVTGWSIGGSGSSHLLNSGGSAGSSASLGAITLKVTNGSSTDTSVAFNWSYIVPPVPAVRWHPGYYFDCSIENRAGEAHLALGNAAYTTIKSCIDFAATQTGVKGVFVLINWASLEGNTAGSYDGSVASGTGGVGTIGFPLIDDLLTYASTKSMKVILGLQWGIGYFDNCGTAGWSPTSTFPAYMVQSSCSGGTDASNTYGITRVYAGDGVTPVAQYAQLWEAASMNRLIALGQAYGTRYDSNSALEKWIWFEQDPSFLGTVGQDGFDWAALATQMARMPAALRPYWTHTQQGIETNWLTPSGVQTVTAAMGAAGGYFTVEANNSIVWQTSYGENTYLGLGVVGGQSFGTHDYRTEIPFGVWTAGPEQCAAWDSYANHNGLPASSNTTPQQFYDTYFTNGKSDETSPRTLKPSHWIVGRVFAASAPAVPPNPKFDGCPTVASQQWGTLTSGGWYQHVQTHTLNTTCPSLFSCNTN